MKKQKLYSVRKSKIHSNGVFAARGISKGAFILEYKGELVSKKEGDRRSEAQIERHAKNKDEGEIYIFELNKKYDIDGNVPNNDAKYINHSCNPNCESVDYKGGMWIRASRNIKKGEELSYDYSYELEDFEEYPCKCGSDNCFGYILDGDLWPKGRNILQKKSKKPNS